MVINSSTIYVKTVIHTKAGVENESGCRIKPGMTIGMLNYRITNIQLIGALLAVILLLLPSQSMGREWPESEMATIYSRGTLTPYLPMGGTELRKITCKGLSTILEIRQTVAKIPRHDVDMGRTELIIYSLADLKVLLKETLKEIWECIGFNAQTRKYLIISKNEHGVKVTLRGLVYLDELKAAFQDSIFGKLHFEATASLYGPDGTYLALIGAPERKDTYRLYVLNTTSDDLREIGEPPAPPPLTAADLDNQDAEHMTGPWEAPERHYTELEHGIWEFTDPHTLRVSYGKDSLKRRSKNRLIKEWKLRTVFHQSTTGEKSATEPSISR